MDSSIKKRTTCKQQIVSLHFITDFLFINWVSWCGLRFLPFLFRAIFEVEKEVLCQSLENLKKDQVQHVKEVNSNIGLTRRRYEELLEEVRLFFLNSPGIYWDSTCTFYLFYEFIFHKHLNQEKKLREHVFMGALIERLSNKIVKAEEGYEQMTISYNAEIQQFIVSIYIFTFYI